MIEAYILMIMILLFMASMSNFLGMWLSMELFTCVLVAWMPLSEGKLGKSSVFLYFITQFMASLGLLISSLSFTNFFSKLTLDFSILLKASCYPFHGWFVKVIPSISWEKAITLMSLGKVAPLVMFSNVSLGSLAMVWILLMGMIPPVGAYVLSNFRALMAFSSVAHASWLVICCMMSKDLLILYLCSYFASLIPICFLMLKNNIDSAKKTILWKKNSIEFFFLMLNVSGVPPFIGFIPKLITILFLSKSGAYVEAVTLGLLSVVPLYLYFKMSICVLLSKNTKNFEFSLKGTWMWVSIAFINAYLFWATMALSSSLYY